jgi:hypothetical protein
MVDDVIKMTAEYGDDFVNAFTKYGDDFVKAISKSDMADDVIRMTAENGDDFVNAFTKYGDDFVKIFSKQGDDSLQYVNKYGQKGFEKLVKWSNADGSVKWPGNDGFAGTPTEITLEVGTRIDRYGDSKGFFVSPQGTLYEARALSPISEFSPYNVYEVIEPITVKAGNIAPWFDEVGGGVQYKFDATIKELIGKQIKEIF